jgi:rifampicin phosphotransferase
MKAYRSKYCFLSFVPKPMDVHLSEPIIETLEGNVEAQLYGGKSAQLAKLYQYSHSSALSTPFHIPESIFLPAFPNIDKFDQWISIKKNKSIFCNLLLQKLGDDLDKSVCLAVAVRSSATAEDGFSKSFAGRFKTVLMHTEVAIEGDNSSEIIESVRKVIGSLENVPSENSLRMGVIIQKLIHPSFSGVAFSSNPISQLKTESIIEYIEGFGDVLVSGKREGYSILVDKRRIGEPIFHATKSPMEEGHMRTITKIISELEAVYKYPVDVEWCIEERTNDVYLLQCRPATNFKLCEEDVIEICLEDEEKIDDEVAKHDKVSLRLTCEREGLLMSRAYLVTASQMYRRNEDSINVDVSAILPSDKCKGFSVVLIEPTRIEGKVSRSFCSIQELQGTVNNLLDFAFNHTWTATLIIQEIYDPVYTGIASKLPDNRYVMEIARGHFIPKGIVPTSKYIVDKNGKLEDAQESYQSHYYSIHGETVQSHAIQSSDLLTHLSETEIKSIACDLRALLEIEAAPLEFGLIKNASSFLEPYLIDVGKKEVGSIPDFQMISEGIISKGLIVGRISHVVSRSSELALDLHLHDEQSNCLEEEHDNEIFVCDTPDLSLLDIIQNSNSTKLGFIFRKASLLCHLAIVLRENGIPSIQISDFVNSLKDGQMVELDASTTGVNKSHRIKLLDEK